MYHEWFLYNPTVCWVDFTKECHFSRERRRWWISAYYSFNLYRGFLLGQWSPGSWNDWSSGMIGNNPVTYRTHAPGRDCLWNGAKNSQLGLSCRTYWVLGRISPSLMVISLRLTVRLGTFASSMMKVALTVFQFTELIFTLSIYG